MNLRDNFSVALTSIKANTTRTILTALIIAIGITALVGIMTSIDGINASIKNNFTSLGANSFTIRNRGGGGIRIGGNGQRPKTYEVISYDQARAFERIYSFPSKVSLSFSASFAATAKRGSEKTNPNLMVMAANTNYVNTAGYKIEKGRNFSASEEEFGSSVVIIGKEIKNKLFPDEDAVGQTISIGNQPFKVIAELEEKGSSMGFGGDKILMVPLLKGKELRQSSNNLSYTISVIVDDGRLLNAAISEAVGIFRNVRKLNTKQEDNFEITQSDSLANSLIENLSFVKIIGIVIGIITLLGASIGLMNIMLVSVTERTREIGTRKAVGAKPSIIRRQFLFEAIVICQMGGVAGIILGIIVGNITSAVVGGGILIPWFWMGIGFLICFIVGILSGIYPAIKASKLDPVDALRYE